MRTRVIVAAIVVPGLALGVGVYAQLDLPSFTSGQVLTAQELNTVVEVLETEQQNVGDLITRVNELEGQLVCNTEGLCNTDPALSEECQEFVDECSTNADPAGCLGGGVFICEGEELPDDVDEENVCDQDLCLASETQRAKCVVFLGDCLGELNLKERCVAGALWICTNPINNRPG